MDRKYQVFVSSTYEDLIEERQEVMHVLLELDCIPAGMELFPAANEDQWSLIKGVIDDCDYYVVIVAGRYGSVGSNGISYTEMEYQYAVEIGKPVAAFLHGDPESIAAKYVEQTDDGKRKLARFRSLVQQKMCKEWTSPHELGSVVSRSLIQLKKAHPSVGWVRGDQVSDQDASAEILALRKQVEQLESRLQEARTEAPPGTENLAQGDERFEIRYHIRTPGNSYDDEIQLPWDDIFHTVSPLMIRESSDRNIRQALDQRVLRELNDRSEYGMGEHAYVSVEHDCFRTIIVQLRALGLIVMSADKTRSVKDTSTYWTLTPYGDTVMGRLRAISRSGTDERRDYDGTSIP